MAVKSVSEARTSFQATIDLAATEAVTIERHGRPTAVIISHERHEQLLEAFEELADVAAFDASLAEELPDVPWDQVRRDLGLT